MPRYFVVVTQEFLVNAPSKDDAVKWLPTYSWSPNPSWEMIGMVTEVTDKQETIQ
jgi:hypothetical protein